MERERVCVGLSASPFLSCSWSSPSPPQMSQEVFTAGSGFAVRAGWGERCWAPGSRGHRLHCWLSFEILQRKNVLNITRLGSQHKS